MKQNYSKKKLLLIFISFLLFIGQINAQKKELTPIAKPSQLRTKLGKVYRANQKDLLFKEHLNKRSEDKIIFVKRESDRLGFTHEKYQQYYKNIKVDFATPIIHIKNGEIKSLSGEFYQIENLNITPRISKGIALQRAISSIGASSYMWQDARNARLINYKKPEGELVILPGYLIGKKEDKLAFKFDIYATKPISRGFVYVDAKNGKVLFYNAIIKHINKFNNKNKRTTSNLKSTKIADKILVTGSATTRYSGARSIETLTGTGGYILNDNTRGNGIRTYDLNESTNYASAVDFTDNDNNWTAAEWDNTAKDNGALDAHWGAEMTYDYWLTKHNRNSFDGAGATINSYVHYDVAYDNAFWDGSRMTYGDGSSDGTVGNGYFDILTSLDVAAHEIGHAICTNTANLAYQKESGAMNEAFSDIWAAAVESFAAPEKSIWLIGEDIERRTTSVSLRSMSDPKAEGQPDTYGGTNWIDPNCTPSSTNDYCGVHTNSGVLNHWFYILSVGKSGTNDIGSVYSVTGIGIDKAAQIAFRIESVYMSANSTYADARTFGVQSAEDLYGVGSPEVIATTNAFYAVGVGLEYGNNSVTYCASKGNSVTDEYIGNVQIGTINNASGNGNGYSDFTAISTDLDKGASITITVTPTWTGTVYSEGYSVWIDYNQDGDFADAGEQVWSKAASQTTPVSGTFTIPTTATAGSTRMRVSMKYNGVPTECEAFSYGEVEDYTVNLIDATADTQAPTAPTLTASNVTISTVDLSWSGATDNVGVTGYDVYKNGTLLASVTGTTYQATGLTLGTTYSFTVRAKDAAGNVSVDSNAASVTPTDTTAPTAPTLTASNATTTTVDLSWSGATDNVGVTGYDVYKNGTLLASVTGTTYQATGLTSGTTYSFTVIAKDAAGNVSVDSNTANVTTATIDTTAPTAPTLTASNTTTTSVDLAWSGATDNVAVTGYDVYKDGIFLITTTAITYQVTGLTPATTYSFTVRAKDVAGNISVDSNTATVTTLNQTITYCASKGTTVTDEYIGNVQIGTINNASGNGNGYSDFTTITTNLDKGASVTITVTPTWTGTVYSEGYSVWIDYNQDGDFADAGEQVWSKAASQTTPVSGTFTIPTTATAGGTRMRVSMKYNAIPTECETFTYGEVEDYTVILVDPVPDNQAPTAPTLTASNATATTADLSWSGATDNVGVTGYDVFKNGTLLTSVTGTTYQATGLTPATSYSFTVTAKDGAGNNSVSSNTATITTLNQTLTYCASKGNIVTDEYIGRVQIGTIDNASGNGNGYSDFTALSTNISGTVTITVTPTWTGTVYSEGYSVWIDYNQDGDFADAGEQVWSNIATKTTPVSGTFTIPTTATTGSTRMRVSMKYNGVPTECETFTYGEVEDYTVVIGTAAINFAATTVDSTISIYPNPVKGSFLTVRMPDSTKATYTIANILGQTVKSGSVKGAIDVSTLKAGVYLIRINDGINATTKKFIKQ
ncbi:GEVED domain-containing protein [Lutibacter sp.]